MEIIEQIGAYAGLGGALGRLARPLAQPSDVAGL